MDKWILIRTGLESPSFLLLYGIELKPDKSTLQM